MNFPINNTHPSWHAPLEQALGTIDPRYLQSLANTSNWLPGIDKIFAAFSLPKNEVKYILFGESPYPRVESANGYAFWDANVENLWSETGLDRRVNRATSLRNMIKMLLLSNQELSEDDLSQAAIAKIDKSYMISKLDQLFHKLLDNGFLLLNTSLVLSDMNKNKEAKQWHSFVKHILLSLKQQNPKLVLLGKIAEEILTLPEAQPYSSFVAPHPYNLSFIHDVEVQAFFSPLHLLSVKRGQG